MTSTHHRIAIVGSGFAGLGMGAKLKADGIDDFVILEKAHDVGGTWRDNTYPGCACDVPSHLYSFSFARNPEWSHSFSRQPEIWDYLRRVSKDLGLDPHLRFGHELQAATWDETTSTWQLRTSGGDYTADVLVSGMGALSTPSTPSLPGLESFQGHTFHSAEWDHDYDLTGKRVAVVGTGASAIQFVPQIAPKVASLTLFQRTAPWVLPRGDRRISDRERRAYRALPALQSFVRNAIYAGRELYAIGFTRWPGLLRLPERLALKHLGRQVPDEALRAKLTPNFRMGCKRILISNDYYPSLTRDNVEVETAGIAEVRAHSVVTTDGTEYDVDAIIFGTGFLATEAPFAQVIRGRGGHTLAEQWGDGMSAYLGTTVPNFPNFFMVVGPNTGLGHTSMVYMIESQVAYIAGAIAHLDRTGARTLDVDAEATDSFNAALQRQMRNTIWTVGGCKSWYLDAHGRNTTLWPDFTFRFRERTRDFDPAPYAVR